jgi:Zn-finger protein
MCFRRELDLLFASNLQKNYVHECHICGLVHDLEKIEMYLMKYAHRNLLEVEKRSQLLQEILEDHPYLDPHHKTPKIIPPTIIKQSHEIDIK